MEVRSIPKRASQGPAAASFGQERFWFLHEFDPGNTAYNCPIALRFKGSLAPQVLRHSLDELIARHESLRTTFEFVGGRLRQTISTPSAAAFDWIDLADTAEPEREATRRAEEDAQRPFDLRRGPLLRSCLLRLGEQDHVLLLDVHHIVFDGWSMQILLQELAALYEATLHGNPSTLPALPIQYADFADWQRARLESGALDSQIRYWKKQLGGTLPVLQLPADRPRPALQTFQGAHQNRLLPKDLLEDLKALSRRERVTLFMTLLAAFQALLYRYTGQEDIIVGAPIAGRTRSESEGLIGFLVNTLALRSDFSGDLTFRDLLQHVRGITLDAFSNQDLPFDKVVDFVQPPRDAGRTPVYQVMFQLRNVPPRPMRIEGLEISQFPFETGVAKFDLTVEVCERPEGLLCMAEYNTDLFDAATIARLSGHFEQLLRGIVADPARRVSELPLLTAAERHRALTEWKGAQTGYPADEAIHVLFQAQAAQTPAAIAVDCGEQSLNYAELNARANKLARYLRKLGVGPDATAGISMDRGADLIVGMLGILKAGGAYVPLDPGYPKERLAFMLSDARVSVLVTHRHLLNRLPPHAQVVLLDADRGAIDRESGENDINGSSGESLAYVIYTSGSTGRPKGVAVPHRAVNRLVRNTDYLQLTAADRVAQISNCSFDAATFEIWGALLSGARLVVIPQHLILAPRDFATEIAAQRITAIFLTTALFNELARIVPAALNSVNTVMFGGEAAEPRWVAQVLKHGPPARLLHVYGPTESTTFASWHEVKEVAPGAFTIPIGRPIANTELYILDPRMNPVPAGVSGELHIGGPGLAQGYLNRQELTAERFVPHPFSNDPTARLYKTGDRVRAVPDGNIEFLGRFDDQVKIRGWRIEPQEVESALAEHPDLRDAMVIVREDKPGEKRLVAYTVAREGANPAATDLRNFLKQKLPEYMLPSAFVPIEARPLTPNGKLDRSALPPPSSERAVEDTYLGPRDPLQYQLVKIWEELLGVHPVGVRDDFFELGGYSLLAVQMVDRVEATCGKKLPLSVLFSGATVEHIADTLVRQEHSAPWTPIVEVQRGDPATKTPFFFLHGDFVTGGLYSLELARALGPDQPFYILQPHGLDGQEVPHTIEDMAEDLLGALRTFRPLGPYYLGGHCNGALIAFEMARRLRQHNERVNLLALVHGTAGTLYSGFDKEWEPAPWMPTAGELNAPDYYMRRGQAYYRYTRAVTIFTPQSYDGMVTVLWPREQSLRNGNRKLGWDKVAGEVDVHEIDGDHLTCITTHVRSLGAELKSCLDRSRT